MGIEKEIYIVTKINKNVSQTILIRIMSR